MHQLQQLHGEFDVAQPTGAELQFAGPHPRGYQFLDAAPHRLHLWYEVLTLAGGPHHRVQRGHVLRAELGVQSIEDLRRALDEQKIRELEGFGEKSEKKLRRTLERMGLESGEQRLAIARAMPIAERLARESCSLPIFPTIEPEQMDRIATAVEGFQA